MFKKPFSFAGIYSAFLIILSVVFLLETYVIEQDLSDMTDYYTAPPSTQDMLAENTSQIGTTETQPTETESVTTRPVTPSGTFTENSYTDDNIQLVIDEVRYQDTTLFVADIKISSIEYLKTALARDTFGKNITEKTSVIAARKGAIFAVNGDYYGSSNRGYVIKNSILYRSKVRGDDEYDDLVIYSDGSFATVNENDVDAKYLVDNGAYQLFAFGPTLVSGKRITVRPGDEVDQAMSSNPRCAIGIIDKLHYVIIVSNGRTEESKGLSLYDLAAYMQNLNCETAYNLDGGGSATMWFNGKVLNTPVSNGAEGKERGVSDIVYIGY